jgi:hypothetical protein
MFQPGMRAAGDCRRRGGIFVRPAKAGVFSRRQSCRGKSQSPVAGMAACSGNLDAEAHRQRRRKDGGESPGRNASERRRGLEMLPRRPSPQKSGEGNRAYRRLTDAVRTSGGVKPTAWWQGYAEQLEKPSSPRREIGGSWVGRITGNTGKSADGERVSEGCMVARKRGNARGAKAPCCV